MQCYTEYVGRAQAYGMRFNRLGTTIFTDFHNIIIV